MSFGIPVITSKESYSKEYFKNKKDLFVFSNAKDLIKKLLLLKRNKKLSEKLSKNSYGLLKKTFSESQIRYKYEKLMR